MVLLPWSTQPPCRSGKNKRTKIIHPSKITDPRLQVIRSAIVLTQVTSQRSVSRRPSETRSLSRASEAAVLLDEAAAHPEVEHESPAVLPALGQTNGEVARFDISAKVVSDMIRLKMMVCPRFYLCR